MKGKSPTAREVLALEAGALRRRCDPQELGFATTAELEPLSATVGQERALHALEFGLEIESRGYNVFATGPIGAGKQSTLEARLHEAAATRPTPGDIVYLPDFDRPEHPVHAVLPAGRAPLLASAVLGFLADARRRIPEAFTSESYRRRCAEAVGPLEQERESAMEEVRGFAHARGVELELTPAGVVMVPLVDGKPVTPEQFALLPPARQAGFQSAREEVAAQMGNVVSRVREIDARAQQRIDEVNRDVALFAIGHLIEELKGQFADVELIVGWLDRVREDVIDNYGQFVAQPDGQPLPAALAALAQRDPLANRYAVNVFVTNDPDNGAPVAVERNPTYQSLFGRLEYETTFGAAVTDHLHLKAGAIHRASGGYLLLHADELLTRPFLWDKLKQVLRSGLAPVENLSEQYLLFPSATLAAEPVPVEVKVVLVGTPLLHQVLYGLDGELRELFRVKADFDVEMPWGTDQVGQYAAFISGQVREQGLRHFDSAAVAAVVEHGARRAAHQGKLSTRLGEIADLVAQASHWAGREDADVVTLAHIERAVDEAVRRSDLVQEKLAEAVAEDTLHIELSGERVGQVNGLAVSEVGEYAFGHPVRITASAGVGDGQVLSIERETKLSGQVHDKGFLTVRGFLQQRYGATTPLTLSASLAFEQSYGTIDGDSAAGAELCALLSFLARAPIDQQVAMTGSVDQHGRIQAVGAVTEKVEGFFAACEARGLTGGQGVILPATNVRHLMLAPRVTEAVASARFHVWGIETIEQAIELLTGVPAGVADAEGVFPEGSVHGRVADRLAQMTAAVRELTSGSA